MNLEFRESRLQEAWHRVYGDRPMPVNLLTRINWECLHDFRVVGHCTADAAGEIVGLSVDGDDILELPICRTANQL